jgi:predicted nucleotide-binding protein
VNSGAEDAGPAQMGSGAGGGYSVDARGGLGVQVGVGNTQNIHQGGAGAVAGPPGHPAGEDPSLGRPDATPGGPGPGGGAGPDSESGAPPGVDASRKVFVVHGRDGSLVAGFRDLLRSVGLEPLEWEALVRASGSTAPFLGEVVALAPLLAQATLVLLSPDDVVGLHPGLFLGNDNAAERARSMQARPNVFYELGLAMMACPERTIMVEVGTMRPAGDLAGRNVVRFTGSGQSVKRVLDRLAQAGCPVDLSGTDWMDPGRFGGLAAAGRHPEDD